MIFECGVKELEAPSLFRPIVLYFEPTPIAELSAREDDDGFGGHLRRVFAKAESPKTTQSQDVLISSNPELDNPEAVCAIVSACGPR